MDLSCRLHNLWAGVDVIVTVHWVFHLIVHFIWKKNTRLGGGPGKRWCWSWSFQAYCLGFVLGLQRSKVGFHRSRPHRRKPKMKRCPPFLLRMSIHVALEFILLEKPVINIPLLQMCFITGAWTSSRNFTRSKTKRPYNRTKCVTVFMT